MASVLVPRGLAQLRALLAPTATRSLTTLSETLKWHAEVSQAHTRASGTGAALRRGVVPHPYKLRDDYAQQTYVYHLPRTSMKDPVYVSITDPLYHLNSVK